MTELNWKSARLAVHEDGGWAKLMRPDIPWWDKFAPNGRHLGAWYADQLAAEGFKPARLVTESETLDTTDPDKLIRAALGAACPVSVGMTIPPDTPCIVRGISSVEYFFGGLPYSVTVSDLATVKYYTLEPLPEPEPEWMRSRHVWADCFGGRCVFTQIGEIWYRPASNVRYTHSDMAAQNPIPIKEEDR